MKIGVIREIKDKENRVALTPAGVATLTADGHAVLVEKDAGTGSGYADEAYKSAGAEIVDTKQAWDADLVVKIKEPLDMEYEYLKDNILFTYLHLAGVTEKLSLTLMEAGTTAIAYETVEDDKGKLPLLAPMSAVAGNMATTLGTYYLAKFNGGKGVQPGTVLGERHGKVMIIGNGIVGQHAAVAAAATGAQVCLFGRREKRFEYVAKLPDNINFFQSTPVNIGEQIGDTDLLVGAVLLPGAKAPYVVTRDMVQTMQPGSVIVDVSIDQGGCIETSRPTSHSDPVYVKHDVIHYCVTNMPGAYPRTSTIALTNATLPYIQKLAKSGIKAVQTEIGLGRGVNIHKGYITCEAVAEALGLKEKFREFDDITIKL